MKRLITLLTSILLLFTLMGCAPKDNDDIIIVFTNDVHAKIDENIGYAGLIAYKKECQNQSKYVTLIDAGDAVQGDSLNSVSKGQAAVDCLNVVNYDILTFGNHEFDFGMDRLEEIVAEVNSEYINSNIVYTGKNDSIFNDVERYKIVEYGDKKVGYIAITTPETFANTTPLTFIEDDEVVYNFFGGGDANNFYDNMQRIIDEVKTKADYVVAITHLGQGEHAMYPSKDFVNATNGVDVVIDAHSHSESPAVVEKNKDGKNILVCSTGTELSNIGQVTISPDGNITTTIISNYADKDVETANAIAEIRAKYEAELTQKLFDNDTLLTINTNGVRTVRTREMNIGDFAADAFRYVTGADIALINGGGLRADLNIGEVSYGDMISIMPFGNNVSSIEMTGQEIVDYLEYVYRYTDLVYEVDGRVYGEYGSFMQLSGLKVTIDTSITPDVVVNDVDDFIEVGEKRRLSDVMVLVDDALYEPIDLNKTYIVCGNDYSLENGGSGTLEFLKDHVVVQSAIMEDYRALTTYAEYLKYDLSRYANVDDRITLK